MSYQPGDDVVTIERETLNRLGKQEDHDDNRRTGHDRTCRRKGSLWGETADQAWDPGQLNARDGDARTVVSALPLPHRCLGASPPSGAAGRTPARRSSSRTAER